MALRESLVGIVNLKPLRLSQIKIDTRGRSRDNPTYLFKLNETIMINVLIYLCLRPDKKAITWGEENSFFFLLIQWH